MFNRVGRDPVARTELLRKRWNSDRTCKWCGQAKRDKRRGVPVGNPYLYVFRVEHDDGRVQDIPGEFCSIGCMRAHTFP